MSDLHEITLTDGTTRKLGNKVPADGLLKAIWQVYGTTENAPLVPRDKWPELMTAYSNDPSHPRLPPVHDQDGIGQCNPEATATALEFIRNIADLEYVRLSGADLYDRINGGSDDGSLLEDAMSEVMSRGIGTSATCGNLWRRGMHDASAGERSRFRVLEAYICPTFEHCMSAVFEGFALLSGIPWYDNYVPDADGWLPAPRGRSGGHAIFGFKPAARNGRYGIWHRQSWGTSWHPATDNCFVIPEAAYTNSIGGWWAIRGVVDEGGVVPTP